MLNFSNKNKKPKKQSIINYSTNSSTDSKSIDERLLAIGAITSATVGTIASTTYGTTADNQIYGTSISEMIDALTGNDSIWGNSGNDTIIGNKGNDYLSGELGNDTYIFNSGDGKDSIEDAYYDTAGNIFDGGSADKIKFGAGITNNNLVFLKQDQNLIIKFKDSNGKLLTDQIIVNYQYGSGKNRIEQFEFANGTILSYLDVDNLIKNNTYANSTSRNDCLFGSTTSESIDCLAGDDTIFANAGNDIITGNKGNDYLCGELGNDTYLFNYGDGSDTIEDAYYDAADNYFDGGKADKIKFGAGITLNNIFFSKQDQNLIIKFKDSNGNFLTDQIIVNYQYGSGKNRVENIEFANGTTLSYLDIDNIIKAYSSTYATSGDDELFGTTANEKTDLLAGNDSIHAGNGDDTITGNKGDDYLCGELGNDTYIFNSGDGKDSIEDAYYDTAGNLFNGGSGDRIKFGTGIDSNNLEFSRINNDLIINFLDSSGNFTTDQITVDYQFGSGINRIENFEFANGKMLTYTDIENILNVKSSIYGTSADDIMSKNKLGDTLYGGLGNDTYNITNSTDSIVENENSGNDTAISKVSYTIKSNIENLTLTGSLTDSLTLDNGTQVTVYGHPTDWRSYLDFYQSDNTQKFYGDCGIIVCENVLIQSGTLLPKVNYSPSSSKIDELETNLVDLAILNNLCTKGNSNPYLNGNTEPEDQEKFLENFNVASHIEYTKLENIANYLKNNQTVIAEVDAYVLWNYSYTDTIVNHAVTITGVAYNSQNSDKIEGFYITDSGRGLTGDACRFVSYDLLAKAFYYSGTTSNPLGIAVVSDNPVKLLFDNINGTGNELNNTIQGNNGNNVLDGKAGNDIIYSELGLDTIIGGTGNDSLYGGAGNDVYTFNKSDGIDYISDESGSDLIKFGTGITKSNISLFANNNNLQIVYGTNSTINIQNDLTPSGCIEKIQLNDGTYLTSSSISLIIQQITSYASTHGVQLNSIEDVSSNQNFMNIIANSWQA